LSHRSSGFCFEHGSLSNSTNLQITLGSIAGRRDQVSSLYEMGNSFGSKYAEGKMA
jgi:hypothetical protein